MTTRKRSLLAAAAAVALVLAACGEEGSSADDDDDGAADGGGEEAGVVFEFVPLDVGGPLTKEALESGQIDIGLLFSSDGAIAANEWVALEDDQNLQPADNFVPAIRQDALEAVPGIDAVLNAVSSLLTVEDMQAMVASVAIDGENPADVAQAFLDGVGLPQIALTGTLTAGSADFAESEIAMELYAGALETAGMTVERTSGIGSREVYIPALESGEIDLIPEFTGTLLAFLGGEASPDLEQTTTEARELAEARGFTLLEPAEADSVNTFVVTQETADEFSLASISDLANVDEPLTLGGPPECPERDFCLLGLQDTYGLEFNV
jgi:osmoprotectant transport system substrate-binding protein